MRDSRAPSPYFTNLGTKVQKIFYICKNFVKNTKIIVCTQRNKKSICIWGWDFRLAGGVRLGSLRLLSPMHGRYYGEKTWAVCSSLGGLQGGDDEAAESGTEMVVRLGIFGRRGMVAEMLAVVRITLFPLGTQGGVFEDG